MHGIKYTRMIEDGDSSVYRKLKEVKPYGKQLVEKVECRNHLVRNFSLKLRELMSTIANNCNEVSGKSLPERKNSVLSSDQDEKLARNRPHRPYPSDPPRNPYLLRTPTSGVRTLRVTGRAQPHHSAAEGGFGLVTPFTPLTQIVRIWQLERKVLTLNRSGFDREIKKNIWLKIAMQCSTEFRRNVTFQQVEELKKHLQSCPTSQQYFRQAETSVGVLRLHTCIYVQEA
jgi:hypothetical protein